MKNLALQVAQVNNISVDDAEATDTGSGQVQRRRGAQTTRPDEQCRTVQQLPLPLPAHLRKDDMATVTADLLFVKRSGSSGHSRDQRHLVATLERGPLSRQLLYP